MEQPAPRPTLLRATDPEEWSALMCRAQAGDAGAYRRLLVGVTPYLRAIAARALRQSADVEDSVQDILLTIHAIRHTYDPDRPFKPWLAGIARHRLIDRLRAQGRLASREIRLEFEHEAFAATEVEAGLAMDRNSLHLGLAGLPDRQREALTLLKLQEMSLAEASSWTGQSISALKVSVHRGLKALRRLLGPQDGSP
jgi:RNA polymerase sigma-70 factor (ECF subfamily)